MSLWLFRKGLPLERNTEILRCAQDEAFPKVDDGAFRRWLMGKVLCGLFVLPGGGAFFEEGVEAFVFVGGAAEAAEDFGFDGEAGRGG